MKTKLHIIPTVRLLILISVTGCNNSDAPTLPENEYRYQQPEQIGDGWETADLNAVGISEQPIVDAITDIQNRVFKNIHAILIVKDDKLVFEEYFPGDKFKLAQYR